MVGLLFSSWWFDQEIAKEVQAGSEWKDEIGGAAGDADLGWRQTETNMEKDWGNLCRKSHMYCVCHENG